MSVNKPLLLLLVLVVVFLLFQVGTFFGINSRLLNITSVEKKWQTLQDGVEEKVVTVEQHVPEIQKTYQPPHTVESVLTSQPKEKPIVTSSSQEYQSNQPSFHDLGNRPTALVIVAYNRPDYLKRTFQSIISTLSSPSNHIRVDIVLSQDGYLDVLDKVVKEAELEIKSKLPSFKYKHIHHKQENLPGDSGYHKLARHFGWFLNEMFLQEQYEQVIILEDDLEIAPDFFEYFDATSPLLWKDPTLYCISAWNDNGQQDHVSDPERLFRSDFFPGLGWMLTKTLWSELGPQWPGAYWDDWLRHPDRRHDRACIRPEISRSYTFGVKGTSNSQFYDQFLKGIQKNEQFIPFTKMDLSYLLKDNFDVYWKDVIEKATLVKDVRMVPAQSSESFKVLYDTKRGRFPFLRIARQLNIMEDEKAGVYRTAYMGVVSVRHQGTQLYIVPRNGPSFDYANIF